MDNIYLVFLVIDIVFLVMLCWIIWKLKKSRDRFTNIDRQLQLLFKRLDDLLSRRS